MGKGKGGLDPSGGPGPPVQRGEPYPLRRAAPARACPRLPVRSAGPPAAAAAMPPENRGFAPPFGGCAVDCPRQSEADGSGCNGSIPREPWVIGSGCQGSMGFEPWVLGSGYQYRGRGGVARPDLPAALAGPYPHTFSAIDPLPGLGFGDGVGSLVQDIRDANRVRRSASAA